jgi:hypothetical protein
MTLRQWLFDNPPSGTVLTTANVRSEDVVAPSTVSPGSGSIQSSDVQKQAGPTSAQFTGPGPSIIMRLPFVAASQQAAVSMYLYRPATAASEGFCAVRAGSPIAHFQVSSTGALVIFTPSGGTTVTGTAGDVPANTWVRLEILVDTAAATASCTSYLGDSLIPIGTLTHNALLLTDPVTHIDVGRPTGTSASFTQYIDSVQMNDGSTAEIGPYVPPAPPGSIAYLRVNDTWVQTTPYMRLNGEWVASDPIV